MGCMFQNKLASQKLVSSKSRIIQKGLSKILARFSKNYNNNNEKRRTKNH